MAQTAEPAAVPAAQPAVAAPAPTPPVEAEAAVCAAPDEHAEQLSDAGTPAPGPAPPAEPVVAGSAAAASAPPVAHCSQNAGDNQYRDPFAGSKPPGQGGGDGNSAQNDSETGETPAPAADPTAAAVQAEADGSVPATTAGEEQLPNTGLGLPGLLALGLPLLLSGLALRRRAA